MSHVIVRPKQLATWAPMLQKALALRGIPTDDFDIERWLQTWLDAPTGTFWARRVRLPEVGATYAVSLKPLKEPRDDVQSEGRLFDAKLLVQGEAPPSGTAIVQVDKVKGITCFGKTVAVDGAPSGGCTEEMAIHYSALGVTGHFAAFGPKEMQLSALVPNERMPTEVLAGFDGLPDHFGHHLELLVWGTGEEKGWRLSTECPVCNGIGDCPNCDGSGEVEVECKVCHGSATVTCKKCGGSGSFGSGDCYSCGGEGTRDCPYCKGEGHFTNECRSCQGDGDCYLCHGSGVRSVFLASDTGQFTQKTKEGGMVAIGASRVFWHHPEEGERKPLEGCWPKLVQRAEELLARKEGNVSRERALREECSKILEGLEKKAERDTTGYPPMQAKFAGASTQRRHGRVLYLFREVDGSGWKKQRTEPYPPGTHLDIKGIPVPEEGSPVVYEGYDAGNRTLTLSFPADMDIAPLRDGEIEMKSAEMRPPEIRQREYLERWLGETDAPVFRAVVEGCNPRPKRKNPRLFNENIARFATQKKAVAYGLSDAPLFLLKGPPGTGKTTIIVEIIRQAVEQGARVLLTSQTHQAVENVLEKLHALLEAGEGRGLRMVHHTAQKGKASALALRYGEEAGSGEVQDLRRLAERGIEERASELEAAETRRAVCAEGVEAAKNMAEEERRQTAEQSAIQEALEQGKRDIAAHAAQEHASLEETLGGAIREAEAACRKNEGELSSKLQENQRREKDIQDRDERIATYRQGGLKAVFLRSFHWFESVEEAEKEQQEERQALSHGRAKARDLEEGVVGQHRQIDGLKRDYAERSQAIDGEAERQREQAEAKAGQSSRESKARYEESRNRATETQRARKRSIEQAGGQPATLPDFAGEEAWRAFLGRTEEELARVRHRNAISEEWVRLLTENSDAITRFLHSKTNVFLATCVGVGGWRGLVDGTYERPLDDMPDLRRPPFFDLVIVDEAGHATFAETVIPISMARRAILIGDDKQLPPMEDDELETESLFTRLWEEAERGEEGFSLPHLMLDTQFRMHPDIAQFVSETFYRGLLKSGVGEQDRAFQFGAYQKAVNLLSTSHQSRRHEKRMGTSYRNELEAEYVKEILQTLVEHVQTHGADRGEVSVAVITPYAEQVSYIRQLLQPLFGTSGHVRLEPGDVASVDKFQGGERDIVIASFVRSPHPNEKRPAKMTFVQDLKRMNVAFSRARRMLILVGDIEALSTGLGNDEGREAFAKFHLYAQDHGREILAWERKEA